jgi:uncharacterized protein YukE
MNLTTFETAICGVFLPLVVSEIFNSFLRMPRMVHRLENLETRRQEDAVERTKLTALLDQIRSEHIEIRTNHTNLKNQCDDDRQLARKMYDKWSETQLQLSQTMSELKGTMDNINQTLRHNNGH